MAGPARNVAERVAAVETDTLESVFGILHNGMRMERARRLEDLWSHIHCLGILAETGSFTAAAASAAQQGLGQPAHRRAGKGRRLPLVRRTTRGVSLTEAGAHLVEQTAAAFQRIEAGYSAVKDLSAGPGRAGHDGAGGAGAAGHRAADSGVPQALPGRADPAGPERPAGRAGHRGFRPGDPARGRGARHACGFADRRDTFGAGRHASVPGRARHAAVPADLERHDCIHYLRRSGAAAWRSGVRGGRARAGAGPGSFAANNSEVLREAALGSVGIALLPDFSAGPALRDGTLVEVLGDWRVEGDFADRLYAVRPIRRMCRAWCPCSSSMSGRPCPRLKHSRSLPSQSVGQRPVMRPGHGPGLGDAARSCQ